MKCVHFLFSSTVLGILGAVLYAAAQMGGPLGSPDQTRQNGAAPNPFYGVDGEGQFLNQLAGPSANRPKPLTILDEISDLAERRAFTALHRKQGAQERVTAAQQFLNEFPQSWFVWQAFEIAAKAAIDLGDNNSATQWARQSLRILPENPLLRVPLAEVETMEGQPAAATQDATRAIEDLDLFLSPENFSEKKWASLEKQLRATSYYILAKAATEEGVKGAKGEEKLRQAEDFADKSLRLNPADPATTYLLGLIRLARGNQAGAAATFAAVYEQSGPFKERARQRLLAAYAHWPSNPQKNFEAFVQELSAGQALSPDTEILAGTGHAEGSSPAYTGSQVCQSCHQREYAGWLNSGHAKMFRAYKFENVFGDFNNSTYADESGKVVARFTHDATQHYIDIADAFGKWHHYRVDYTVGSKWQQTYATRLPNGEIQVIPLQYNRAQKQWIAFWKMIDAPGSMRAVVTNFPALSSGTAYLARCGPCHTSQLRVPPNMSTPAPKDLTFAEGGINCEMCHGPGGDHVASMRLAKPGYKPPLKLQVEYGKISSQEYVAICGQCHLQSQVLSTGPEGEINYRHSAETFYVAYRSRPYGEFRHRAFYKDGRFRVITFGVEAFRRSACYQKGHAQCGHCHDFHPSDSSNVRDLKFLDHPDQMCLQCHPTYAVNLTAHTHHAAASEGSRCTACHMPKIVNSVMFKTMEHTIDDIPNAEMTARFGQADSPNACLICHPDKGIPWLRQELSNWNKNETSAAIAPASAH
jgi:tetratricopeptide (TPR) repeat protein